MRKLSFPTTYKNRTRRPIRCLTLWATLASASTSSLAACSYDFDQFADSRGGGASTMTAGGGGAGPTTGASGGGAGDSGGAGSAGTGSPGGTDANIDSGQEATATDARGDGAADAGCVGSACVLCAGSTECWCASYNGHGYQFCTTARSWTDSEIQCTTAGMRLTRVDDVFENTWIRSTADARGMGEAWIGVEDPMKTLHWQWPDGTQFWTGNASGSAVGGLYNDWSANNPSGIPVRNCASMLSASSSGQWSDRSCTSRLPYVCEVY